MRYQSRSLTMEDDTGAQYALPDVNPNVIYSPILISFIATLSAALGVVLYHFILVRFCQQTRRESTERANSSSPIDILRYSSTGDQGPIVGPHGLDEQALKSIPILPYSDRAREFFRIDEDECVVCLTRLEKGELVRWLPGCTHTFHVTCIDSWLHANASCPTCRAQVTVPPRPRGGSHDSSGRLRRAKSGGLQKMVGHNSIEEEIIRTGLKRSLSMDQSYVVSIDIEMGEVVGRVGGDGERNWRFLHSSEPLPTPMDWRSILGFDSVYVPNVIAMV